MLLDLYEVIYIACIDVYYRVYKKKRNLGISQEIHFVFISTKDFMPLGI